MIRGNSVVMLEVCQSIVSVNLTFSNLDGRLWREWVTIDEESESDPKDLQTEHMRSECIKMVYCLQ